MQSLAFAFVAVLYAIAYQQAEANLDFQAIFDEAERAIDQDFTSRFFNGAKSDRFLRKKTTATSRSMSARNAMAQKSMDILVNDRGMEPSAARALIDRVLNGQPTGSYSPVGHAETMASKMEVAEDICNLREPECDAMAPFRTINGRCNNVLPKKKTLGAASTKTARLLPQIVPLFEIETYETLPPPPGSSPSLPELERFQFFGISGNCSARCPAEQCVTNAPVRKPNPRLVSSHFHTDDASAFDQQITHMVTQFGQFLDHDLTLTPEEEIHDCCHDDSDPQCFPISIPRNDGFYQANGVNKTCLEFTRSVAFCDVSITTSPSESGLTVNVEQNEHEQMNVITAFIDASNVYGSDDATNQKLRTLDGTGKLKLDSGSLLPFLGTDERVAGDIRSGDMPGLAVMHTLFVREHNRICDDLRANHQGVDSTWTDEDIFQNARRLIIAQMQNIVYREWLPIVMGNRGMERWGLKIEQDSIYDQNADPSILNSFATAAFRFGHTLIQGLINMLDISSGAFIRNYELGKNFFNLTNYEFNNGLGMEQILKGLTEQNAQGFDRHVTEEVTNKLFAEVDDDFLSDQTQPPGVGSDLVSRNLQRGRDHGLPSYLAYARLFTDNHELGDCWARKPRQISRSNWNRLQQIYDHPHHIDLFTGGLAETPFRRGLTGQTFQGIFGRQFRALKHGDRFFYSHQGNFATTEFNNIRRRRLSDIICQNTNIQRVAMDAFKANSAMMNCNSGSVRKLNMRRMQVFRA